MKAVSNLILKQPSFLLVSSGVELFYI